MSSASTSTSFPLYGLNKVCFLAVAEQMDNRERRYLSQSCQRFRRLLIPEDRYRTPPASYWTDYSINQKPKQRNKYETRLLARLIVMQKHEQLKITVSSGDLHKSIHIGESGPHALGLYDDIGDIRKEIVDEMRLTVHKSIHEVERYFVFTTLSVYIENDHFVRLPVQLHRKHDFRGIPITINSFLMESAATVNGVNDHWLSETALRTLAMDYRDVMPEECVLMFQNFGDSRIHQKVPETLRILRRTWPENSTDSEWIPCIFGLNRVFIKVCKVGGKLVVTYDTKYVNQLPD